MFSLFAWDDGDYIICFTHEDCQFDGETVEQEFVVAIGGCRPWDISGEKWNDVLQLIVTPPSDPLTRFINEVRADNILCLRNDKGQEITRFSLKGSAATLNQHQSCEILILPSVSRSDPLK
ncbi:MAG: hypothetical protein ABGW81_01685 [Paracoccaceae bacterium]